MALCYLNRGIIIEQALCSLIHDYFDTLHLDNKYKNFHVSVVTDHPFAELYMHEGLNAADHFPAVIVNTIDDTLARDFQNIPDQVDAIGITKEDLKEITQTQETYIKNGKEKKRDIPGLCTVVDSLTLESINAAIDKHESKKAYGYSLKSIKQDSISVEIWAENVQLKNEIYKQLVMYIAGNLKNDLEVKYKNYGITIFSNTVTGHPSNNYNFDFDVALAGAQISFDLTYWQEQIVINTELAEASTDIVMEVINYGKETY